MLRHTHPRCRVLVVSCGECEYSELTLHGYDIVYINVEDYICNPIDHDILVFNCGCVNTEDSIKASIERFDTLRRLKTVEVSTDDNIILIKDETTNLEKYNNGLSDTANLLNTVNELRGMLYELRTLVRSIYKG